MVAPRVLEPAAVGTLIELLAAEGVEVLGPTLSEEAIVYDRLRGLADLPIGWTEVPEAGTHNLWVEGDMLYVAYYNGGLRVVDISGDLMGNLYDQGREVAWYLPTDHEGKVPNAPMVWGPQPHKGKIFFSDWNSGLWAVELAPPQGE